MGRWDQSLRAAPISTSIKVSGWCSRARPQLFFVVLEGLCEIEKMTAGSEQIVERVEPGGFFGETSLLLGSVFLVAIPHRPACEEAQPFHPVRRRMRRSRRHGRYRIDRRRIYRRDPANTFCRRALHLHRRDGRNVVAPRRLDARCTRLYLYRTRRRRSAIPNSTQTRDPYLLETSIPGIFAVGDVRHGSMKPVASSVGEGSMAIALVHQFVGEPRRGAA